MWLYLLIFGIAVAWYLATREEGEQNAVALGIYLGVLGLFVACADMLGGYDRYIYGEVFDELALVTRAGGDVTQTAGYTLFGTEWLYLGFNQLMALVTMNRYIFIFAITIVIYTLLFFSIRQYCDDYPFAVILFLGLWFFFTFTYLRQVTAATIGWLAIRYCIDRKPLPFFAIVLLAYGMHNSAIVLAPLYFVPQRKFSTATILVGLVACLVVGMTNILSGLVAEADAFTNAARIEENAAYLAEGSFRIAYFLEAAFFITIILWQYDLFDDDDPRQMTLMNMAIAFCAILLLFVRSDNGGRVAWHYMIGLIATITYIARNTEYHIIRSGLTFLCLFLFLRIFNAWQLDNALYPYKTFFTDGHRDPDAIHAYYEYDPQYDRDKFYKL